MSAAHVLNADCLAALRDVPDASVDAIVTDPPYGLSNTTPAQAREVAAHLTACADRIEGGDPA